MKICSLDDTSGLNDSYPGVLDGKDEINEENDAGDDSQYAKGYSCWIFPSESSIVLNSDSPDSYEQDSSHQVDKQLQDGQVGPN